MMIQDFKVDFSRFFVCVDSLYDVFETPFFLFISKNFLPYLLMYMVNIRLQVEKDHNEYFK